MTEHIIVADDRHARVITMRRPEKKNAVTHDMYRAMSEAIDTAQNNPMVAPGHTEAEARKVAREICDLPAEQSQ